MSNPAAEAVWARFARDRNLADAHYIVASFGDSAASLTAEVVLAPGARRGKRSPAGQAGRRSPSSAQPSARATFVQSPFQEKRISLPNRDGTRQQFLRRVRAR